MDLTKDMLSAFKARLIANKKKKEYNEDDLISFLEAVKAEAEMGNFKINLASHHKDIVPILNTLGYVVTPIIDDIGSKFEVSWY